MKRTIYIIAGLILLVVGLLLFRGCKGDSLLPTDFAKPLPNNTAAQVVIDNRHIAVRTDKETKAGYVPDDGSATTLITEDGEIELQIKDKGFTLRPTIGIMVADQAQATLGAQLGYWKRLELHVGLGIPFDSRPQVCGWAGIAYRLDQITPKLQNTSVGVAYTSRRFLGINVLVRF